MAFRNRFRKPSASDGTPPTHPQQASSSSSAASTSRQSLSSAILNIGGKGGKNSGGIGGIGSGNRSRTNSAHSDGIGGSTSSGGGIGGGSFGNALKNLVGSTTASLTTSSSDQRGRGCGGMGSIGGMAGMGGMGRQTSRASQHPPLSAFDACVEACDALAASAASATSKQSQHHQSTRVEKSEPDQSASSEKSKSEEYETHSKGNEIKSLNEDSDGTGEDEQVVENGANEKENSKKDENEAPTSNDDPTDQSIQIDERHHSDDGKYSLDTDYVTGGNNYNLNINTHDLLPDCSVLVSPDGALLFLPKSPSRMNSRGDDGSNGQDGSSGRSGSITLLPTVAPHSSACKLQNANFLNDNNASDANDYNARMKNDDKYPWTKFSSQTTSIDAYGGVLLEEEYESAVVYGNDLVPPSYNSNKESNTSNTDNTDNANDNTDNGDYISNGFTARGWSPTATSIALSSSRDVLGALEQFIEDVALCSKDGSVRTLGVCSNLGGRREEVERGSRYRGLEYENAQYGQNGNVTNGGGNGNGLNVTRPGPILHQGTTLCRAMDAMEQYYSQSAEMSSQLWRAACSESLPSFHKKQLEQFEIAQQLDKLEQLEQSPADVANAPNAIAESQNDKINKPDKSVKSPNASKPSIPPIQQVQGLLPAVRSAVIKAENRISERELALMDVRGKVLEAEKILKTQKDWAAGLWSRVQQTELEIDRKFEQRKREQLQLIENIRRKKEAERMELNVTNEDQPNVSDKEIWEMIVDARSAEDFDWSVPEGAAVGVGGVGSGSGVGSASGTNSVGGPGGIPAEVSLADTISTADIESHSEPTNPPPSLPQITRAQIERESDIQDLKLAATAADEFVEDAAGKLLNIMSKHDTTMRSARIAAESCLLSQCNAAKHCLTSIVALERACLNKRLEQLNVLEEAVESIDVRGDIDKYIQHDKVLPGGATRVGKDDDGGIAAGLAVLNSHISHDGGDDGKGGGSALHIKRPNFFEGWGDNRDDEEGDGRESDEDRFKDVEPEITGDVIQKLFEPKSEHEVSPESLPPDTETLNDGNDNDNEEGRSPKTKEEIILEDIILATRALAEKNNRGQTFRQAVLYELNNQRSIKTQVEFKANFDRLCRIFSSFLDGCGREPVDVSNAKLLMILSQTFFFVDQEDGADGVCAGVAVAAHVSEGEDAEDRNDLMEKRKNRIYVKNKIASHRIWSDEDFWDQALYQCVSESLKKSGVMMNYIKPSESGEASSGCSSAKKIKWHDLSPNEYADVAAQVHSVVFAQLGTLSHSMLELGCGVPRACNFVRRLSIRYQLPLSLRTTLIQHITKSSRVDNEF